GGNVAPKPKRDSSPTPRVRCTCGGARTSRPSGSIASTRAPSCRNRSAAKFCIRPCPSDVSKRDPGSGSIELIPKQRLVELLDPLVVPPGSQQLVLELREGTGTRLLCALQPGVQNQRGKFLLLVDLAEDGAHLADHQFEHVDLFVEDAQHGVLDRVCRDQ